MPHHLARLRVVTSASATPVWPLNRAHINTTKNMAKTICRSKTAIRLQGLTCCCLQTQLSEACRGCFYSSSQPQCKAAAVVVHPLHRRAQHHSIVSSQGLQQLHSMPDGRVHQQRAQPARALQVDVLLGGVASVPIWVYGGVLLVGVLLGMVFAKLAGTVLRKQTDPYLTSLENAELRTKVQELQDLVLKVQPLAYKSMRLRFTKGINKAVILGMVDQMLSNKEVNIWWLPDSIERLIYLNMMTLMLSVLDEVVDGMSISLAGHNVRLQLTYLDVAPGGEARSKQAQKVEAALKQAMEPPKTYQQQTSTGSSASSL